MCTPWIHESARLSAARIEALCSTRVHERAADRAVVVLGSQFAEAHLVEYAAARFLAHGACDRSVNELSARAGVCRSIVKQAIKYAERDGLITVLRRPRSGRKHLTNIIHIVRADWLAWLDKGRRKAYAIAACSRAKPDFHQARGLEKKPPRSQDFRNSGREHVDKTVKKKNQTGAGRA